MLGCRCQGYVNHFLLNGLVTDDNSATVRFYTMFNDFVDPLPVCEVNEFRQYMQRSMDFVRARNQRIANCAAEHLAEPSVR